MTTNTEVVYLDSAMSGAPALNNTAGSLINVLDAGLVAGFGSVTLDSLAVADDVATASVSTGHNLAMLGATGPVVLIEGATPSSLNGRWRVASVPTVNTFTFATLGIADQAATGTIAAKRAPTGWTKPYSGTHLAAYRPTDPFAAGLYLYVDDTGTTNARFRGYEAMIAIDAGTEPFPTDAQLDGGLYAYKATAANRPWLLVGDGRLFYLLLDATGGGTYQGAVVFGDVLSYAAADGYPTLILGSPGAGNIHTLYSLGSASAAWLARSSTGLGDPVGAIRYSHGRSSNLGAGGQNYPAPADNRAHLWPVELWESTPHARGWLPGLWNPIHSAQPAHGTLLENIPALPDRTLQVATLANAAYRGAFDITGPWR